MGRSSGRKKLYVRKCKSIIKKEKAVFFFLIMGYNVCEGRSPSAATQAGRIRNPAMEHRRSGGVGGIALDVAPPGFYRVIISAERKNKI